MRLFLCFVFPPFAVLLHGKPISAIFNMLLCMFFWAPGVFHALSVNAQAHDSRQTKQIVRAINGEKSKRMKSRRVQRPAPAPAPRLIDDKYVGENGTRFRKRQAGTKGAGNSG